MQICFPERIPFQRCNAEGLCTCCRCCKLFGGLRSCKPDIRIHTDAVTDLSAKQLIKGDVQYLRFDIPHGDIHRRDSALQYRAQSPVRITVQFAGNPLDLSGILSDQDPFYVLNRAKQSMFLIFQRAFPDAGHTLVGFDLYENEVGSISIYRIGFNICDFHLSTPLQINLLILRITQDFRFSRFQKYGKLFRISGIPFKQIPVHGENTFWL